MKLFKSFIVFAVVFCVLGTNASANSGYAKVAIGDNSVGFDLPSDFTYITAEDVDKPAAFFKNLPLDKNEVIDRINNKGVVIDAFSSESSIEIKCTVTSDGFSKAIANLTPMDDNDKQSVINTFKAGIEQSGHAFLSEPQITDIDGYDFIDYNCRIGSGNSGYSYRSVMTIVGGKCYEFTAYCTLSVPDDETKTIFDEILNSVSMDIEGESGQIAGSIFKSVIAIVIIIAAALFSVAIIYSLFRQWKYYKNRNEKVRLKKRQ